jgi:hypothetical protein
LACSRFYGINEADMECSRFGAIDDEMVSKKCVLLKATQQRAKWWAADVKRYIGDCPLIPRFRARLCGHGSGRRDMVVSDLMAGAGRYPVKQSRRNMPLKSTRSTVVHWAGGGFAMSGIPEERFLARRKSFVVAL